MTPTCAREQLTTRFQNWLDQQYAQDAQQLLDKNAEVQRWVHEQGEFVAGTGLCVFAHCELCGQYPKVLEDGRLSKQANEPDCLEHLNIPGVIPVITFPTT